MTPSLRGRALLRGASAFLAALMPPGQEIDASGSQPGNGVSTTGLRQSGVENRCPVCQASFRGARICSRCGADLQPLMLLTVKAWQLRQAARQALEAGDIEAAHHFATEAQEIQATRGGDALRLLSALLR